METGVEICLEKVLTGHKDFANSIIFFEKYDMIVTASYSTPNIKFWNSKNFEQGRDDISTNRGCSRIAKWDEDSFIYFDNGTNLSKYSFLRGELEVLTNRVCKGTVLKVSCDLLVIVWNDCFYSFDLFNVTTKKLISTIKYSFDMYWTNKLVLSTNFQKCFYAFHKRNNRVDLLSCESGFIKSFCLPKEIGKSPRYDGCNFCIYQNEQKEEILIVGGRISSRLYFFNVNTNTLIRDFDFMNSSNENTPKEFLVFKNSILFIGDQYGNLLVFDIRHVRNEQSPEPKLLAKKNLIISDRRSYYRIICLNFFKKPQIDNNSLTISLIASSYDFTGKIISVKNLPIIMDSFESKDLIERIEFLLSEDERIFSKINSVKWYFKINICDQKFKVFRFLFL